MSSLNEIHELPLANRLVDAHVRAWLDRKFALQFAQYAKHAPEWKALGQARHVALDGYTYELTPAILDARSGRSLRNACWPSTAPLLSRSCRSPSRRLRAVRRSD